ncbi:MAG TPA: nitrate- and nitrite sensing domain-containing protein [Streptosporangiaceae bacterium]|nr:nitrate- and nitrite sensing domain-containing protein [Streptosporangiaceae bacterium]
MSLRRRSVLLRVTLLVLIPLVFLVGIFSYAITSSAVAALTLIRARSVISDLKQPVANLQHALTHERAQMIVYNTRPAPAAYAALQRQQAITDHATASFLAAADSPSVRHSTTAGTAKAIATLRAGLTGLPRLRAKITGQSISGQQAFTAYNDLIAASYQILEQSIIAVGNARQVLPAIAVIELAVSNEYLQQESALLDGNFAAHAFPASEQQAFVSLVGAHRLLYAQSYSYLNPVDRANLDRDVNPQVAHTLVGLEDTLVASPATPKAAPPVPAEAWNAAVATLSRQTRRAVEQAEARLAQQVSAQATAKLHSLYLDGGLGLAAVIVSLIVSLWIAVRLARQLHGLRDSALELANVALPSLVRRLRAGEEVDVGALVRPLEPGADEIGQVKAAFNSAQRTAVESAVDEARVRRGINDLFRNLARRSQSLLERQMGLLDALERTAADPGDLDGLFRIDHLTTRMRRHAENLLVLAGDSPKRAFREPVPFVDVLRAAATEVEDYKRIKVIARTPAALAGPVVSDVIHLLAELLENGTIFSPSDTEVRITGALVANGYAVDIEDRGPGMSGEELAAVNASLADPPLFDMSGSDRLGLFVAARLARRHGIAMTLRESPYRGVTAIVLIPRELVVLADAIGPGTPASQQATGHLAVAGHHAVTTPLVNGAGPATGPAGLLAVAEPTGLAEPAPPVEPAEPAGPSPSPSPSPSPEDADASGAPPALTENGMPRRVRQSSLAPQLRTATALVTDWGAAASSRSPEKACGAMSAFRHGWQQGISGSAVHTEADTGQDSVEPQDGESR